MSIITDEMHRQALPLEEVNGQVSPGFHCDSALQPCGLAPTFCVLKSTICVFPLVDEVALRAVPALF